MAGSYQHCRKDDGTFQFDLIENMGDAYEACEMLFFMVGYLADQSRERIHQAEEAYYRKARGEA